MSSLNGQKPAGRGEHHPLDDLAIYALDAVGADDRSEIEAHLAGCTVCQRELAAHRAALACLVVDEPPPPTVWDAVVAQIRVPEPHDAEEGAPEEQAPAGSTGAGTVDSPPEPVGAHGDPAHVDRSLARRRAQRRGLVGMLAAAAVAVAVVGIAPRLWDDDGGKDAQIAGDTTPEGRTVGVLAGADGTEVAHVVAGDEGEFVVFDRVQPLAGERTYQLWAVDGPEPVSVGLLGDGAVEAVPVDLPDSTTQLAISDEPNGGSISPQGPIIATGDVTRPT